MFDRREVEESQDLELTRTNGRGLDLIPAPCRAFELGAHRAIDDRSVRRRESTILHSSPFFTVHHSVRDPKALPPSEGFCVSGTSRRVAVSGASGPRADRAGVDWVERGRRRPG